MQKIVIVDFKSGNIGSIQNILKKVGHVTVASSDPKEIASADKLILPGVGAFDNAISNLEKLDLIPVLNHAVLEKKIPVLGICLGMQILGKRSEEGQKPGLGWVNAETVKFQIASDNFKIPHMGWDYVNLSNENQFFEKACGDESRFYFVHSYHMKTDDPSLVSLECLYGYAFPAAVHKENIFGVQFHPEKSHRFGMKLLSAFAEYSH